MLKSWNHHSFVNISPTLVIDTSMERSSRVLQHGNPRIFFSKKFEIRILTRDDELKSPYLRQYQSYNSNWYINGKVFTSTTTWTHKNLIFFSKKFGSEFQLVFCLTCFLFKFEIEFWLIFDLCQRAEVIQVGLNKHLYDDIGDASSSLPGSTSSLLLGPLNVMVMLNYRI